MIKEAINRILELAVIEKFTYEEREYTSKGLVPVKVPTVPELKVTTLQGLVDYLKSGFDEKQIGRFSPPDETGMTSYGPLQVALHVVSPSRVEAFLPVDCTWKERVTILSANWDRQPFPFGQWLDQESFVIKMQAMFQQSESWPAVMEVAGKIVCQDEAEIVDDGVAQAATVKRGIRQQSGIILPNPVSLKPVRTFTEVEQPESKFVFRMRAQQRVELSLHEADMGAWQMVAKGNIKAFLEQNLPGIPVFM